MFKWLISFLFAAMFLPFAWAYASGMDGPLVGKRVILGQAGPYKDITTVHQPLTQQETRRLQRLIDEDFAAGKHDVALHVLSTLRRANIGSEALGRARAEKFRTMSIAEAKHRMAGVEESLQKGCPTDASYQLHHVDLLTELFGGAERHIETYARVQRWVNTMVTEYRDEPIEQTMVRNKRLGCFMG